MDRTTITKTYQDPDEVLKVGKNKAKKHNLTIADMARGASCKERDGNNLKIKLVPVEEKLGAGGQYERVTGTGVSLHLVGGYKTIYNQKLLQLLMGSTAWDRGQITMDDTDPTGFWQEQELMKTKEVKTIVKGSFKHPKLGDIDFAAVTAIPKDETMEPISKVV